MPSKPFSTLVTDPRFKSLPETDQTDLVTKYWDKFKEEQPGLAEFADAQKEVGHALLTTSRQYKDAAPAEKRLLEVPLRNYIDVLSTSEDRLYGRLDEAGYAAKLEEQKAAREQRAANAAPLAQWADPKFNEGMQSSLGWMTELAKKGNVFGSTSGAWDQVKDVVSKVTPTDSPIADAAAKYTSFRNTIAGQTGLKPDEVDDLVRHRMEAFDGPVSRDTLGQIHFKDSTLAKPVADVVSDVKDSNLPESIKGKILPTLLGRVTEFKANILADVMRNHKELAGSLGLNEPPKTPEEVDAAYTRLDGELQKTRSEQFGGGVKGAAQGSFLRDIGAALPMAQQPGVVPTQEQLKQFQQNSSMMDRQATIQQSINDVSHNIYKAKTELLGTDAATIGQGVYSGAESVAVMAATSGLGGALMPEARAAAWAARMGKVGELAAKGTASALDIAPLSFIYGSQQGAQTLEQAQKLGLPMGESMKLAAKAALIEGGITMLFSGIGAGGTEDVVAKMLTKEGRELVKKSVAKAWYQAGKETVKGITEEELEENTITFLNQLAIQKKLTPSMTDADVFQAVKDTFVSTLFASGPLSAVHGFHEQGLNLFKSTHDKTNDELESAANAAAAVGAAITNPQENLPSLASQGGPVETSSVAGVAAGPQMTMPEFEQWASEKRAELEAKQDLTPDEQQLLDVVKLPPAEAVKELDVSITEPGQPAETVTAPSETVTNAAAVSETVTPEVNREITDFSDPNTNYRVVVGDAAFQDIVDSGVVRTNDKEKGGQTLQEKLAARPTAFPSFSRGSPSISYAQENPNHYIIVSTDPSIQPSAQGRHGKGRTMFPTDESGNPVRSLSGEKVDVYKHLGNGKYELVYSQGKQISPVAKAAPAPTPNTTQDNGQEVQQNLQGREVQAERQVLTPETSPGASVTWGTGDEVQSGTLVRVNGDTATVETANGKWMNLPINEVYTTQTTQTNATQEGKQQEGDLGEYQNRDEARQAAEAGDSNRAVEGGQVKEAQVESPAPQAQPTASLPEGQPTSGDGGTFSAAAKAFEENPTAENSARLLLASMGIVPVVETRTVLNEPRVDKTGQMLLFQEPETETTTTQGDPAAIRFLKNNPEPTNSTGVLMEYAGQELFNRGNLLNLTPTVQKIVNAASKLMHENVNANGTVRVGRVPFNEFLAKVWGWTHNRTPGWPNFRDARSLLELGKTLAHEAARSLAKIGSGVTWYSGKINEMYNKLGKVFPELAKDGEERFLFSIMLAVTSNGENVFNNMDQAVRLYELIRGKHRLPTPEEAGLTGKRQGAVFTAFNRINAILEQQGWEQTRKDFLSEMSYKDMRKKYGISTERTEFPDHTVLGAMMLGPKIGAFFGNLNGNFKHIAMDLWFTRTMNRLSGDFSTVDALEMTKALRKLSFEEKLPAKVKAEIDKYLADSTADEANWTSIPAEIREELPTLYQFLRDQYNEYYRREDPVTKRKFYRGTTLDKSAKEAIEILDDKNTAPKNADHRKWMRDVISATQKRLKAGGINISNAELQAVLWYNEKDLYGKFGATSKLGERADFAQAAENTLRKRNMRPVSTGQKIEEAQQPSLLEFPQETRDEALQRRRIETGNPDLQDTLVKPPGLLHQDEESVQRDKDYLAAVERGDMEAAQRMVDEAAKKAGYNVGPVYHGGTFDISVDPVFKRSNKGNGVLVSDQGIFFSDRKGYADFMASNGGKVTTVFLRLTNPREFAPNEGIGEMDEKLLRSQGYDGWHSDYGQEYVVFDPSQIKSADPVTRDAQGNVIPLSKRFNPESPSILYQDEEEAKPGPKGSYLPKARNAGKAILDLATGKADPSTGLHEAAHATFDFMDEVNLLTEEESNAVKDWASNGTGKMDVAAWEKFARGWERFVVDGVKTGIEAVDRVFAKLAAYISNIYKNIEGSSIDIEIPDNIRAIFNKMAARGYQIEQQGKAPTPVPVEIKTAPAPKPATKPKVELKLRKPSSTSRLVKDEIASEMARLNLAPIMDQARQAIPDIWDNALAEAANNPMAGSNLATSLLNNPRTITPKEHGLLLREYAVRKLAVAKAQLEVQKAWADGQDPAVALRTLEQAYVSLRSVAAASRAAGAEWGRTGRFMQISINEDFSIEAMATRYSAEIKDGAPLSPAEMAMVKTMSEKLARLEEEIKALTAKDVEQLRRIAELEALKTVEKQARREAPVTPGAVQRDVALEEAKKRASSARDFLRKAGFGRLAQDAEVTGADRDAEYLAAVERGDMETAQRMVDEAAKRAGYNRKGVRFGFYVNGIPMPPSIADQNFGPGYYIAEDADPSVASSDVSVSPTVNKRSLEDAGLSEAEVEFRRDVVYVKAQRPLEGYTFPAADRPLLDATIAYQSAVNDAFSKTGRFGYLNKSERAKARKVSELEASISSRTAEHQRYLRGIALLIKQGKIDYDSLRGQTGRSGMSSELVVQNPSQIKSADPVTRDAQGNVIPLSQRFNPESPSILYQDEETTPEPLPTEILQAFASVGAEHLLSGIKPGKAFTQALVDEFGEAVKPHVKQILEASKARANTLKMASRGPRSIPQLMRDLDPENPNLTRDVVFNMAKAAWMLGYRGTNILDHVTEQLQSEMDVTREQVSDAFTGYGKVREPSKEEVLVQLRELRNVERIMRQIQDAEAGQPPLMTGLRRDKPTEWIRRLQAELKVAMEKAGMSSVSEEGKLKGALDAVKTRLKNRKESLIRAIREHEKIPKTERRVTYDEEAQQLRDEVDKLQSEYDEIFDEKSVLTEEQREERAIASLTRQIELEKRLAAEGRTAREKGRAPVDTPATRALRTELKALVDARHDLAKRLAGGLSPEQRALMRAEAKALAAIRRNDEILRTGVFPTAKGPTTAYVPSSMLQKLRQQLQDGRRAVAKLRRSLSPKLTPEQRQRRATIKALEKSNAALEAMIASGNLAPKSKTTNKLTDPQIEALRRTNQILREGVADLRKAARPVVTPEQRSFNTRKRMLDRKIAETKARIARGDFARAVKKVPAPDPRLAAKQVEYNKLVEEWNKGFLDAELARRGLTEKGKDAIVQVVNVSRAVMTSADFSAMFRQGGFLIMGHPVLGLRAAATSFAATFSEERMQRLKNEIEADPNYALSQQAGLYIADRDTHTLAKQEEAYRGRWARKGWLGKYLINPSERSYVAFLNKLRMDSFNMMVNAIGGVTPAEAKVIARFINIATGRGDLGKMETAAQGLATIFFSPKFVVSRFQLLTGSATAVLDAATGFSLARETARARKAVAWQYARSIGGIATVYLLLALAKSAAGDDDKEIVETDPRSSDFGKVKIGNTRVDFMGGLLQAAVFVSRIASREKVTSTGKVLSLTDTKFGQDDLWDLVTNFLKSKTAPWIGTGMAAYGGKDALGRPTTAASEAVGAFIPLSFGDIYTAMREHGMAKGLPLSVLAMFGIGLQVQDNKLSPEQEFTIWTGLDEPADFSKKSSGTLLPPMR